MAETTAIEWCDSTFNPWTGCTKISPACDHCYAEGWAKRSGAVQWGNHPRRRTTHAYWRNPVKWQEHAVAFFAEHGRRRRVFCASLADVFDNQVDPEWRRDLFALIRACPDLDWLLLTKRPQNIIRLSLLAGGLPWNVALGTTVEDQPRAGLNLPHLLAAKSALSPLYAFVSTEPLLGRLDLWPWLDPHQLYRSRLDWVIAGGESGSGARPMHVEWVRGLRDQCQQANTPFLFKQWGCWVTFYDRDVDDPDWRRPPFTDGQMGSGATRYLNLAGGTGFHGERVTAVRNVGKKAAGRLLDGVEHNGFARTAA